MTTTPPPRDWVDPWPGGHVVAGAPASAIWLARLVDQLQSLELAPHEIAIATALDERTVASVLEGTRWPSLHTSIALLQVLEMSGPRRGRRSRA